MRYPVRPSPSECGKKLYHSSAARESRVGVCGALRVELNTTPLRLTVALPSPFSGNRYLEDLVKVFFFPVPFYCTRIPRYHLALATVTHFCITCNIEYLALTSFGLDWDTFHGETFNVFKICSY